MTSTPPAIAPAGFILPEAPGQDPVTVYLNGLDSAESRRTMDQCLARLAEILTEPHDGEPPSPDICAWWLLRHEHTQALRSAMRSRQTARGEVWSPAYIEKHRIAIRQVLRTCRLMGLMTADDCEAASAIKKVNGRREPAGRSVADDELLLVLAGCVADETPAGIRDAAIIAFMKSTGCRRGEVASARRANYDPAARRLKIIGKGDKERIVFPGAQAAEWINRWLALRAGRTGPLFCPVHWSGKIQERSMTSGAVWAIVERRCRAAGVAPFTPHDLRRTFVGDLWDQGADPSQVTALTGHSKVDTAVRYDRRPEQSRQAVSDQLRIPTLAEVQRYLEAQKSGTRPELTTEV